MLARIVALFRRVQALRAPELAEHRLERGELMLNPERLTCYWQEQAVDLTVTEFWIVHDLAGHPGHVKNRDQLMDAAYGEHIYVDDRTIDSHVKNLRRKLGGGTEEVIHSIYGVGYKLVC